VPRSLVALAGNAGSTIITDECPQFQPGILPSDECQGAVLSEVTGEDMVMFILKYTYSECVRSVSGKSRNPNTSVVAEKTGVVDRPAWRSTGTRGRKTSGTSRIFGYVGLDVGMKLFDVHNNRRTEDYLLKKCRSERRGELILGENWA